MENKTCKKCGKELSIDWKDKLCEDCRKKRKDFINKVYIGLGIAGVIGTIVAAVAVGSANSSNNSDADNNFNDNHTGGDDESLENFDTTKEPPLLPIKAFLWVYDHWGADEAQEVFEKVQNGEMSVEDVEKAISRPDIEPEDWRDFEDGWRPDGW